MVPPRVRPAAVEELDRTCLDHIARYKRPSDYRFVDALPTNNYGKVLKRELRDLAEPRTVSFAPPHVGGGRSHEARSLPAQLP